MPGRPAKRCGYAGVGGEMWRPGGEAKGVLLIGRGARGSGGRRGA